MELDSMGNQTFLVNKFVLDMRRFLLFILGASVLSTIDTSLLNFKVMIERITKKNALIYFNGYGCYCGKGGRGKPRDKTDMCCYLHDCCYEKLHRQKCHPYIEHYRYLIINGDILCNYRNKSMCSTLACECDQEATMCFQKEANSYNPKLRHYPGVLCKEITPRCPELGQGQESSSSNPRGQQAPGASPTTRKLASVWQLK